MEIGREQHGEQPKRREGARDDEHHPVGALHRFEFLRALRGKGLFDAVQPEAEGFGAPGGGGIGFLPVALDGDLRGVKLLLHLQP